MTDFNNKSGNTADSDSKADSKASAEAGLVFPCRYPVKAMTRTEHQALDQVLASIRLLGIRPEHDTVRIRPSRNGRFQSITVQVDVSSREQLEQLYTAIRALDVVVMTL